MLPTICSGLHNASQLTQPKLDQMKLAVDQEELTIKLSHFLTELEITNDGLELWLVDEGDKPAVHIDEGLTE